MSTFGGVVDEFPDIRIDFFRPIRGRRAPRACFLSHVHSDHLAGLENKIFHGNFLYCSPATREILLRLKKYLQRLNFAKGILESAKVTYEHLKDRLKTIPLETPTCIELEPGNEIQVTLFDANHCTGAVMFLIEGNDKAILYTGDIRSEPWFVNNLTRNPFLIEFTSGLKKLDCIYLDTSNIHPIPFPTKAEGLKELLQKVLNYPADTVFHFEAWTFGYEEVWMALSRTLKSKIHVDDYKLGLYSSLRGNSKDRKGSSDGKHLSGPFLAHEGPVLAGYKCGNTPQAGCLTSDQNVRLHSCEKGMHCDSVNEETVRILPIITRTQHGEMAEIGVGGGGGDLTRRLELEVNSEHEIDEFLRMFAANTETPVMMDIKRMLHDVLRSNQSALSLDGISFDQGDLSLKELTQVMARFVAEKRGAKLSESLTDKMQTEALPRTITFPYSRHSSYAELCSLVKVFDPKDIYPCTVDEANWDEGVSMEELFGQECSATKFRHDEEMRELHAEHHLQYNSQQSQTHTTATSESSQMLPPSSPVQRNGQIPKLKLRRNSQGRLRQFDADGNEVVPPGLPAQLHKAMTEDLPHIIPSTPPHEIIAKSPGSESQDLRRKAIDLGMRDEPTKRPRLKYDGHDSSLSISTSNIPSTPGKREHNLPAVLERSEESEESVHTPGSDADTPQPRTSSAPPIPHPGEENIFWDDEDNVPRCKLCGHEVWSGSIGFCTGDCQDGPDGDPYFELLDPEAGPRPGIVVDEYASDNEQISSPGLRREMVGDYLDDHSDAYDTVDENPDYRSEYEGSFIDDASINDAEHEDEDASSSDGETDYKQLNVELQAQYDRLLSAYVNLEVEHDQMMRDFLGSEYGTSDVSNPSDIEGEEGSFLMVTVSNPDPAVAELVLSQAQEQSQESEISADRLRDRAKAFEAADDGQGWQNISLVSTGDNHTHEEVEL